MISFIDKLKNSIKTRIPLWMNEGLAEYVSDEWSANSDMWIRESIVPPPLVSAGILAELMKKVKLPANLMHTGQEQIAYSAVPANSDLLASVTLAQYSRRRGAIIATFEANLVDVTQVLLFRAKISGLVPLELS